MAQQHDLTPILRDWLREPDRLPPPRIAEIGPLVHQTPQQRGVLPPLFRRFRTMFQATSYIAAGLIVALTGAFLLGGALTSPGEDTAPFVGASPTGMASPAPTATEGATEAATEALSPRLIEVADGRLTRGFVGETTEPGVVRVTSDGTGARFTPSKASPFEVANHRIIAGDDGSVWIFGPNRFYQLGKENRHRYWDGLQRGGGAERVGHIVITRDGTIWSAGAALGTDDSDPVVRSYDGKRWRVRRKVPPAWQFAALEVASDGAVWALAFDGDDPRTRVHRLDGGGWKTFDTRTRPGSSLGPEADTSRTYGFIGREFALDGDAGFWLGGYWEHPPGGRDRPRFQGLLHFDGEAWQEWDFAAYTEDEPSVFDSSAAGIPYVGSWPAIDRFVDGRWEAVPTVDRVDRGCGLICLPLTGTPDGRLWATSGTVEPLPDDQRWASCGGLVGFDGTSEQRYLTDLCVTSFDAAPDGSVWALAGPRPTVVGERTSDGTHFTDLDPSVYVISRDPAASVE